MDKLDLTQPLEAIHRDAGETISVKIVGESVGKWIVIHPELEGGWFSFKHDGTHAYDTCPWTIRNTAKPSTPSNEELTQRMEKLVRLLAECEPCGNDEGEIKMIAIAKAIVSDLPKPVDPIDPDLTLAKRLKQEAFDADRGSMPEDWITVAVRNGIRAGRTLAAGGTAHE